MWFQARYVTPIVDGRKTITVRKASSRLPAVGAVVPCSVGPRAPFAHVHIDAVIPTTLDELDDDHRAALESLYPERPTLMLIRFHRIDTPSP